MTSASTRQGKSSSSAHMRPSGPLVNCKTGSGSHPQSADNSMGCRFYGTSTFGLSLQGSRGDPARRLTAWVPPCSRSVQPRNARIAPRFPRPSPAEGPRRSRQCRSGPAGTVAVAGPDGRLAGGGGRSSPARRRISPPTVLLPVSLLNKWRVNSPRTGGRGRRQDPRAVLIGC